MGVEAQRVKQANRVAVARKIRQGEDRFCRAIVILLPKKSGETGTAQTDLQPIHHKFDRLLGNVTLAGLAGDLVESDRQKLIFIFIWCV